MIVAGIDVSTRAIDIVALNLDTGQARHQRYELGDGDLIDRVRTIGVVFPTARSSLWDDVIAIGIERPAGRYGVAQVAMAFGAVVSRIPVDRVLRAWMPAEWRKACGLPGNAGKDQVAHWAIGNVKGMDRVLPQDAYDAAAIAYATRQAIRIEDAA